MNFKANFSLFLILLLLTSVISLQSQEAYASSLSLVEVKTVATNQVLFCFDVKIAIPDPTDTAANWRVTINAAEISGTALSSFVIKDSTCSTAGTSRSVTFGTTFGTGDVPTAGRVLAAEALRHGGFTQSADLIALVFTDGVSPVVSSAATTSSTTIALTMSETVTNDSAIPGDFTIGGVASTPTVTGLAGSGSSTLTLTLNAVMVSTDTPTVTYTLNGRVIDDGAAGNQLAAFAGQAVTNNVALPFEDAELPADHYLGYDAKRPKDEPKFEKFTVELSDQFEMEPTEYTVEKPDRLYNPVQKTHDGTTTDITDFESHYVGYKIKTPKGDEKFEKRTDILVQNQFGEIIVDVKKPKLLLVPSAKDRFTPPDPLDLPLTVNHFKCYDVKESKDTPKFVKRIISVFDPNFDLPGDLPQDFEVKKPKMLCTPVDKDGEGIVDGENHLMCYDVKKLEDDPKFEKLSVFTNNQFGPEELEVKKQKELCLPSIKTPPLPKS